MRKISPKPLSVEVAERLRTLIHKNELHSGQKLSEQGLCARLGVSRTPLREAFRILSAEGLISLVPNRGAFVAQASLAEIREMFEVMSVLEGACARLATQRMGRRELARLEELHEALEQHCADNDAHGYVARNHDYHTFIQEQAGNSVLRQMASSLREVILLHRYRQILGEGRLQHSMQEHRQLLAAFRDGDAELAEQQMRRHLMNQCKALETLYADADREAHP